MTIEEIKQDYYYHCSFGFQNEIVQMWICNVDYKICFYNKSTEVPFFLDEKEVYGISRILNTASNCFFQRRILKEEEQKEKVND